MEEDYREFEAKTVDEAVILAMKTLHADFDDLDIKVVSEGSKGLFGIIGNKTAKILVRHEKAVSKPEESSQKRLRQPQPLLQNLSRSLAAKPRHQRPKCSSKHRGSSATS